MPEALTLAFGVATLNIPAAAGQAGDLSRAATRSCITAASREAALIGFQELSEDEDHADVLAVMPKEHWWREHADSENETCIRRTRFRIVNVNDARLAGPNNLTPAPNRAVKFLTEGKDQVFPHRDLTWCVCEFVENPRFTLTAIVNTHYNVLKDDANEALRVSTRAEQLGETTAWVAYLVRRGINVILVGDFNWHGVMPKVHPDQRWLVNDGIDKIAWIPSPRSNFSLRLVSAESHKTASDHPLRVANVEVKANSRYQPPPAEPPVVITPPVDPPTGPVVPSLAAQVLDWIESSEADRAEQLQALRNIVEGK